MLYIDMTAFYLQNAGGITSVWKELIIRLLRDKKDVTLILQRDAICRNIYWEQIMAYHPCTVYESGKIRINRYLPVQCRLKEGNLFVSTYYRRVKQKGIKQFVTVHDFTYEYYVKGIRKYIHAVQKRNAVKCADMVICVSENTMKDMHIFYPWSKNKKSRVIYNAANDIYKNEDATEIVDGISDMNGQFLLYVGSRAPYKRFDLAVEIAAKTGYYMVIIGGGRLSDKENKMLAEYGGFKWKHLTGISDGKLNYLYRRAYALIYPSEYEGFGIPLIEAQSAGCPVIAYNGSSVSEVMQDKATLMGKTDISEAERILKLLSDYKFRKETVQKGYKNAKRFSWERTYKEYLNILKLFEEDC